MLNYKVGTGKILTSDSSDLVIAKIKGYLRFDAAGIYALRVNSNDGVRLDIGGKRIFNDPNAHPDRMSESLPVEITEPGWYAVDLLYFEKKGTATLELYWRPPGAASFDFVPAEAFGHAP